MALQEQADIAPLPERQVADVGTKPEIPSLISSGPWPVSEVVLRTAFHNGPTLSFQAMALVHLIDDVLKTEAGPEVIEESGLAEPRLPGENANDTLRYLLRGLRRELNQFVKDRDDIGTRGAAAAQRLDRLQQFALGVVGALRNVPSSGAGDALRALIGGFLDHAGLQPWEEFLSTCRTPQPVAPAPTEAGRDEARKPRMRHDPVSDTKPTLAKNAPSVDDGERIHSATGPFKDAPAPIVQLAECEAEDPLEIPLILVRPIHGDWARLLIKKGLGYLTKRYGEPAETLKPLLKKWLAQSGHDHKKVFKLIAEAQARNEPDPKSWVGQHLAEQAPA